MEMTEIRPAWKLYVVQEGNLWYVRTYPNSKASIGVFKTKKAALEWIETVKERAMR